MSDCPGWSGIKGRIKGVLPVPCNAFLCRICGLAMGFSLPNRHKQGANKDFVFSSHRICFAVRFEKASETQIAVVTDFVVRRLTNREVALISRLRIALSLKKETQQM